MAPQNEPPASGLNFSAGGNQDMSHARIAGRDINEQHRTTHIHKNRKTRIGIGLAVVLLLGGGGYWAYHSLTSSSTDVVYESGLQGAVDTASQLRQAELSGNADEWCFLGSATSGGTCRGLMSNSFSAANTRRPSLGDYTLGAAAGDGSQAQVPILHGTQQVGDVELEWTGSRWQLNSTVYLFAINNGGLMMTAAENAGGCGALLGIVTSCH